MMLTTILQLFLAVSTLFASISTENEAFIAFVDVTVIPMAGPETLEHQTVLVRNDRIVAVGAVGQIVVPDGASVIDGRGRWFTEEELQEQLRAIEDAYSN